MEDGFGFVCAYNSALHERWGCGFLFVRCNVRGDFQHFFGCLLLVCCPESTSIHSWEVPLYTRYDWYSASIGKHACLCFCICDIRHRHTYLKVYMLIYTNIIRMRPHYYSGSAAYMNPVWTACTLTWWVSINFDNCVVHVLPNHYYRWQN